MKKSTACKIPKSPKVHTRKVSKPKTDKRLAHLQSLLKNLCSNKNINLKDEKVLTAAEDIIKMADMLDSKLSGKI